jgi:hypothetical protein
MVALFMSRSAPRDQCLAKSRMMVMAASAAKITAAVMRQSKLIDAAGIGPGGRFGGTGGSRIPIPACLRGGPLKRPEACDSGSQSYSAKSCGMEKNVTPLSYKRLEEPENGFDRHPGGNRAPRAVARGHKFPGANGLHRALVEPQSNSLRDADLRRAAVRVNQNQQRHRPLQPRFPRFVRVLRIGAIRASWQRDAGLINPRFPAYTYSVARRIAHRVSRAIADGVAVSPAGGTIPVRHPGQANVVYGRKNARRGRLQNRWRNGDLRIRILWNHRLYKLNRRSRGKIPLFDGEKIMARAVPASVIRMKAAKAVEQP